MSYPQTWTPESEGGSRSHTYEAIQPNQENYMEMHRRPVPIPSGQVMDSQTRGKFTAQKAVVLLVLLCTLLLITCIVLGSTRCSSSEKRVEIPHQWLYFQNSMYLISRELKSWDEASHTCENFQGNLVIINNEEEEKFVEQLASIMEQNLWLGLTDRASEGVWKWVKNIPFTKGYWSEKQSESNDGTEDCVSAHSGGWHAKPCDQRLHYICEVGVYCTRNTFGPTYQGVPFYPEK